MGNTYRCAYFFVIIFKGRCTYKCTATEKAKGTCVGVLHNLVFIAKVRHWINTPRLGVFIQCLTFRPVSRSYFNNATTFPDLKNPKKIKTSYLLFGFNKELINKHYIKKLVVNKKQSVPETKKSEEQNFYNNKIRNTLHIVVICCDSHKLRLLPKS